MVEGFLIYSGIQAFLNLAVKPVADMIGNKKNFGEAKEMQSYKQELDIESDSLYGK